MRLLVAVVGAGAALALIAASGLMNYVFMTSLGKTAFEQYILGVVSVAISVFLALLPTLMVWAWREGRSLFVLLGLVAFLGFGALSLSSAIGFAAKNRGSISEDRALAAAKLGDLKQAIKDTETKLKALSPSRPFAVIQESLRGLKQDARWQSSKSCREATVEASRSFCKGYFELKGEAARATEAAQLEQRLAELKGKATHLEEQGAGREADNQAAVLARRLGLQTAEVESGLTLFLPALVEIGAAFGLYFATGHLRAGHAAPRRGGGAPKIEADAEEDRPAPRLKRAQAKQITRNKPRRLPRLSRGAEEIEPTNARKEGN
jgi:hypothetical protein